MPHLGLMSGAWTPAAEARAVRLGCRIFRKPFFLRAIDDRLGKAETLVPSDRGLLTLTALAWRVKADRIRVIGEPALSKGTVLRLVADNVSGERWVETWDGTRWCTADSSQVIAFAVGLRMSHEEQVRLGIVGLDPSKARPQG